MNIKRILTILGVVLVFSGLGVYLWLRQDEPPPDVSDLWLERLDIPDEENAFTYLDFPDDLLYWPEDEESAGRYRELESGEIWDEELALEAIEYNRDVMERFNKGMACKHLQVPEVEHMDSPTPYLAPWRGLARFMSLHARYLQKTGKEKEALDMAMRIVEFGDRIENSRVCIIGHGVGNGVRFIGMTAIRRLLMETTLNPEDLRPYISQLAQVEASAEAAVNTFKIEYMSMWRTIDAMVTGRLDKEYRQNNWGKKAPRAGYFFKPNATKRLMAEAFRAMIENARSDFATQKVIESLPFYRKCESSPTLSPNKGGQMITLILMPALSLPVDRMFKLQAEGRATEVLIALKCYKLEHGELPASLDELVPEYLDEIPKDPYDGKPMRYSKEKRIVYSVWENMIDEGGKVRDENTEVNPGMVIVSDNGDLIVEIEF